MQHDRAGGARNLGHEAIELVHLRAQRRHARRLGHAGFGGRRPGGAAEVGFLRADGELHVIEHRLDLVQVGVDADGLERRHQVFGLLADLHALDGQHAMRRTADQLLLVLVLQHAGGGQVGRAVGLAVLAQAFAGAVVLSHHRAHQVHVAGRVDFFVVLDLVAHQREHRPERLQPEFGRAGLLEKVVAPLGHGVDHAAGLVVDLVHTHHALFGFLLLAVVGGGQRLARAVVAVGRVIAGHFLVVNLLDFVGREEHFMRDPARADEPAQLLAARIDDDGRRVGKVEHQALAHDHFGLAG